MGHPQEGLTEYVRRNRAPLNVRLRAEADEWENGEGIVNLLLEAANAIEHMAATIARLTAGRGS